MSIGEYQYPTTRFRWRSSKLRGMHTRRNHIMGKLCEWTVLWSLFFASSVHAHPLAPSLLELQEQAGGEYSVRWKTPSMRAPGADLEPNLPEHCRVIEERTAEILATSVEVRWRVGCGARGIEGSTLGVTGLDRSRTSALIRVVFADGRIVKGLIRGDAAEFQVVAGQGVARSYLELGFEHILFGPDHLLFILGLLLLIVGARKLVGAITSFTLGHSLTLGLAIFDLVRVPQQVVEIGIAISLVVVALELVRRDQEAGSLLRKRPWLVSFGFGLLHGLGFASALRQAGLPGDEIPQALLFFNLGIEAGQLAFIAGMLGILALMRSTKIQRAWVERVSAYAIGSLAVYWVLERGAVLF